jgi:predicted acyltransferase
MSKWKKAGALAVVGLSMCLFGVFLWKGLGIPLIKHIFTPSIAFLSEGLCVVLLAATYVVTDIWKFRRGTGVVLLWGQCALFAYFVSHVFCGMYTSVTARCLQGMPRLISDQRIVSVVHAVFSMVVLTFLMAVWRQFRASLKNTRI